MQSSKRRGWKTAFLNLYWACITNLESEKYLKNKNFWLCSCKRSRKSVLDKILELEMQTNQAAKWADTYSSMVTPTYRTSSQIGLTKSSKRLNFKQAKKNYRTRDSPSRKCTFISRISWLSWDSGFRGQTL